MQHLDIGLLLKRQPVNTLEAMQALAIELENDFISAGKWKKDFHINKAPLTTSSNPVIQRLANDVISLKRKISKGNQPIRTFPEEKKFNQGTRCCPCLPLNRCW